MPGHLRWKPYRRTCRLSLELLEDRLTLSGSSIPVSLQYTKTWASALWTPVVAASPVAGASGVQTTSAPGGEAAANPAMNDTSDDDDSTYQTGWGTPTDPAPSNNSAPADTGSDPAEAYLTPNTSGSPISVSSSQSRAAGNAVASTTQQSAGSTPDDDAISYIQRASANSTTNSSAQASVTYYYCSPEMYAQVTEEQARTLAARNMAEAEEIIAARTLLERERTPDPTNFEKHPTGQPEGETAEAQGVFQPTAEPIVAPAPTARIGDSRGTPGSYSSPPVVDWLAALDAAFIERENGLRGMSRVQDEAIALSSGDGEMIPSPPISILSGDVAFNVAAMERGVRRFFDHLQEQSRDLMTQPGALTLGSLLAAGVATTAAFELARRWARARLAGPACGLDWREESWAHDSDLALLPPRDEA